jgi:predicted nucleic acid-binding protein
MPLEPRYWDSSAFLGWLAKEPDKVDDCRGVIRQAEAGNLQIVTSALSLAEVIKIKGETPLPLSSSALIREFFKHEYIVVRQLDRFTAETARELIWEHGLAHNDAVHLATAIRAGLHRMDSFDVDHLKLSGQFSDLVIGRPDVPEQLEFVDSPDSGSNGEDE